MSHRQNKKNRKAADKSLKARKPVSMLPNLQGVITPTCEPPRVRSEVTPPMRKILVKLAQGQLLRWNAVKAQYELLRSTAKGSAYAKVRCGVAEALLSLGLVARGFNRAILNIVSAGLAAIGIAPKSDKRVVLVERDIRHAVEPKPSAAVLLAPAVARLPA